MLPIALLASLVIAVSADENKLKVSMECAVTTIETGDPLLVRIRVKNELKHRVVYSGLIDIRSASNVFLDVRRIGSKKWKRIWADQWDKSVASLIPRNNRLEPGETLSETVVFFGRKAGEPAFLNPGKYEIRGVAGREPRGTVVGYSAIKRLRIIKGPNEHLLKEVFKGRANSAQFATVADLFRIYSGETPEQVNLFGDFSKRLQPGEFKSMLQSWNLLMKLIGAGNLTEEEKVRKELLAHLEKRSAIEQDHYYALLARYSTSKKISEQIFSRVKDKGGAVPRIVARELAKREN